MLYYRCKGCKQPFAAAMGLYPVRIWAPLRKKGRVAGWQEHRIDSYIIKHHKKEELQLVRTEMTGDTFE